MGITVQHSPSPLTVGYAALYAGQGQRAERDAERRQRESMQMREIAARQAAQDAAQEFNARMAEQQFERQKEMASIEFDQKSAMDAKNFEQQMEFNYGDKAAQFKQTIAQNEFDYKKQLQEYELTEKEKIENSRIQDRISWVEDQVRQGTWSEEEGAQAIAQLQGIRKPPKVPKTTIQDQVKSDIWKDPDTGIMWNRKPDGSLEPVHPPKGAELGDVAKLYEGALKALKRVNPETDEEIPPTQAEIDQYIERVMALRQRITGSGTGQPAPAPQIQIPSAGEARIDPNAPSPSAQGVPTVSSEAQYQQIPPGAKYIGPDGRIYIKT